MTYQIKYLLVPIALSLLAGCGKPEADNPSINKSEEQKLEEMCEAYRSGQMAKNFELAVAGGRLTPEDADRFLKLAEDRAERQCEGK